MPVSVRRHNLVRLREELNLTQSALADWIGRSFSTIKAIETTSLRLSKKLATLIASITGADPDWLLRNNLDEPMPPLKRTSAKLEPGAEAYGQTSMLLFHLYDRLLALTFRLKPGPGSARNWLQWLIEKGAQDLKKGEQEADAEPIYVSRPETFEFFKAHPELLDPDLVGWINLDYLLKDAYRKASQIKVHDRRAQSKEPALSPLEAAQAQAFTEREAPYIANQKASPSVRKGPRQNPASPAPGGQHKSRRSSSNPRDEARN